MRDLAIIAAAAVILFVGVTGMSASPAPHFTRPTPMPSAKGCDYFKRLLAPTKQAFDKHHLSARQRSYIMKYVNHMPLQERRYAKWIVDSDADDGFVILSAFPVFPDPPPGGHAAWTAVNTNVAFDPIECHEIIMPVAARGQVRSPNGRI